MEVRHRHRGREWSTRGEPWVAAPHRAEQSRGVCGWKRAQWAVLAGTS